MSYTSTSNISVMRKRKRTIVGAGFTDALIIVEVGGSQAVSKVRAHLFPRNDEIQRNLFVSLLPEHHGTLGLIPRRSCQHGIFVTAPQFFLLQNGVTCG